MTWGIMTPGSPAIADRKRRMFRASCSRSISASNCVPSSSISANGCCRLSCGHTGSRIRTSKRSSRRSVLTWETTPGRRTLTTASCPSCVRARCTWATDAAAKGTASNRANSVAAGWPNASSIAASASRDENGGTRLCKSSSTTRYASGSMSRRKLKPWPSFTNVVPSPSSVPRRRSASTDGLFFRRRHHAKPNPKAATKI